MPYCYCSWRRPHFLFSLKCFFDLRPTGVVSSNHANDTFKYYSPVPNTIDIARWRCEARFGVRWSTGQASLIAGCAKQAQTVFVSEPHPRRERRKSHEREAQSLGRAAEERKE